MVETRYSFTRSKAQPFGVPAAERIKAADAIFKNLHQLVPDHPWPEIVADMLASQVTIRRGAQPRAHGGREVIERQLAPTFASLSERSGWQYEDPEMVYLSSAWVLRRLRSKVATTIGRRDDLAQNRGCYTAEEYSRLSEKIAGQIEKYSGPVEALGRALRDYAMREFENPDMSKILERLAGVKGLDHVDKDQAIVAAHEGDLEGLAKILDKPGRTSGGSQRPSSGDDLPFLNRRGIH